jgi:hypothetical protein
MESLDFYTDIRFIIFAIIMIIIIVINRVKKKFELIEINTSAIIVSRLFMAETAIYFDEIKSITLKELKNDKSKIIIQTEKRVINVYSIDFELYEKLDEVARKHSINFNFENIIGIKYKV